MHERYVLLYIHKASELLVATDLQVDHDTSANKRLLQTAKLDRTQIDHQTTVKREIL